MSGSSNPEDEIIRLNEETQIAPPDDENQLVAQESRSLQSYDEHQRGAAVFIPSFNLNEGNFEKPNFGPVTKTKHVEANKIEHATIVHHHHHNYPNPKELSEGEEESTSSPETREKSKLKANHDVIPEGYVEISEDIFMYTKEPIRKGTSVFKGFQRHITRQKQPVAIKRISPCDEKSIREVQHLVNLSPHPNVVRILRSKVCENLTSKELYIVMELCKSQNLEDHLKILREKKKPLDLKRAMSFAQQLVNAVKHIHQNDIIHGDLKPENILYSLDGEQIKVSDFGVSKQLRDFRSKTKLTGLGTDGYRAPETYSSDVTSKSADIYSLGIILFALFANGAHPHGSDPHLRIYNIKRNTDFDLSALPEEMGPIRGTLIAILVKIFQLDPKKRPTIEEVDFLLFRDGSARVSSSASHTTTYAPAFGTYPRRKRFQRSSSALDSLSPPTPTVKGGSDGSSVTFQKFADLRIDDDKVELYVTRILPQVDFFIQDIYAGILIYSSPEESPKEASRIPELSVKINGYQRSIRDLQHANVYVHKVHNPQSWKIWPGIVIWLDHETSSLMAFNLCGKWSNIRFRNECDTNSRFKKYFPQSSDPRSEFPVLPIEVQIPIFSVSKFIEFVKEERRHKSLEVLPGVQFQIFWPFKCELCRITPRLSGHN